MHENLTTGRLDRLRRTIWRRRMALTICGAALMAGALLWSVALLERWLIMREPTALTVVAALALGSVGMGLVALFWAARGTPRVEHLARDYEARHPELMDALNCAVDVEALAPSQRRVFERGVIDHVHAALADAPLEAQLLGGWRRPLCWILTGICAVALLGTVWQTRIVRKAGFAFHDVRTGMSSGLEVAPGSVDLPEGSDVAVTARIHRWDGDPAIEIEDADGRRRYPMHARDDRRDVTLYGVNATTRYRVVTPSLRSPWHTVTVYRPPVMQSFQLEIIPPEYTGLPTDEVDPMREIAALEGSGARFTVGVDPGVKAFLDLDGHDQPVALLPSTEGERQARIVLETPIDYRIRLTDTADREIIALSGRISTYPDAPPLVDAIEPARDLAIAPDSTLRLRARAGDDFGLAAVTLVYRISGGPRNDIRLHRRATPPTRDIEVQYDLDPQALAANDGDVISYFFTATDTREPDAQHARSEVYFIEIRSDIDPDDMPDGEDGGETQELDILKLLAELRRLIRLTHDVIDAFEPERADLFRRLNAGMADLHTEVGKIIAMIPPLGAPPEISEGLDIARDEIRIARDLLSHGLADDSLPHQGRALHRLTQVAQELMKNTPPPSDGAGAGESTEALPSPDDMQQREMSMREIMEAMRDLAEYLTALADRQGDLSERLERLADRATGDAERRELADRQQAIVDETHQAGRQAEAMDLAADTIAAINGAAGEMVAGAERIPGGDLDAAGRHGRRAQAGLLSAADGIRQRMQRLAAERIAQLGNQAQSLAERQNAAADTSAVAQNEAPPESRADAMQDDQRDIGAQFESLMSMANRAAADLREDFPDAGQAVAEAVSEARQANLGGRMQRAESALTYRRFDRAVTPQRQAADGLRQMAQAMHQAAEQLPSVSREELAAALQAVQQSRQRVQDAMQPGEQGDESAAAVAETAESMARQLSDVGNRLDDARLAGIGVALGGLQHDTQSDAAGWRALGLLEEAAGILQRHLLADALDQRLELIRQTSGTPAKYRGLVEAYFKSLSESRDD